MKFPLRERPFQGIQFTPEECAEYETLVNTIVDATLEEHERFVHLDNRLLSKKQWKAVKTRDDVTVFKRTGRELPGPGQGPRLAQPAESYHWRMPKMIAVGTLTGLLDDIMYGIVTPDAPSMLVKAHYVQNEMADGALLKQIRGATLNDPFQFVGIKWMVKAHAASLNTIVWPRDFVYLESTGLRTFPDGSRMGFHAVHTINHPLCGEVPGIVRGKFSSCYLYFQRQPDTVEVYMTTFVDPGGNASEGIAVMSTANMLIGVWKSAWCAQNKMLAWLLENDSARRRFRTASNRGYPVPPTNKQCCHLCNKSFGSFRSVKTCQLCSQWVCSKCRIARKITSSNESLELLNKVVEVCKRCIAHVAVADAFEAAVEQYVGMEEEKPPVQRSKSLDQKSERHRECSTETSATMPGSLTSLGDFSLVQSWREENSSESSSSVVMETADDWDQQRKISAAAPLPAMVSVSSRRSTTSFSSSAESDPGDDECKVVDHQTRLYRQMQSLCLTAEQTYQFTSLNASRVLESSRIKQP